MIEVLFSILLISFVLIALLHFQLMMLTRSNQSMFTLIATVQLLNLSEMLEDKQTPDQKNAWITQWNNENQSRLPNGSGEYQVIGDHLCEISIRWVYKSERKLSEIVFCR